MRVTFVRVSSIESKKSSIESENSSYKLDFLPIQWKTRVHLTFSLHFSPTRLFTTAVEKSSLPHFLTSLLSYSTFHNGSGKVESTALSHFTSLRLDFSQRQWKSRVYRTFSLHFSPTRLFTTAVEKSSLPHFLTSLLSDSTFHNGSGKVESTALSHFTSLRLDFSQRQWKSRVYRTFSLHFSPTRLFTTAVEKSSLPHFLTSLLSDSTFHNGSGKVESTALSHFTSLRLDFLQRQWKSRVYLTFSLHFSPTRLFTTAVEKSSPPHFLTSLLSDSTFYNGSGKVESTSLSHFSPTRLFPNGSGKVESTSLSHFTSLRLDFSQRRWKSRVYLTFSLHSSPTRLFTTAVEKSSLPHFLTSFLSDSTFYNGSGKVESTSLSHFTSVRLDFLQRQWKSRVYLTFSLHFCPTRLFTTAVEKSSLPHFLTSLLSDSTFYNGGGKVEST